MKNKRNRGTTKLIINGLLMAGGIAIAVTSPFFIPAVLSKILKHSSSHKFRSDDKKENKKNYDIFSNLVNRGLIKMEDKRGQIFIALTEKGKEKAGKYQINDLKIQKQEKWDKKWRILIFDIKNEDKIKREALRGKIKDLGLYQLQKSVWVYPYEFQKEIKLLRSFFGLNKEEMKIITAAEIEDDYKIKLFFKI